MTDPINPVTLSPAEQMREAAAQIADIERDIWEGDHSLMAFSARKASEDIAAAIRALPLPPEPALAVKVKPLEWDDWSARHRANFTATTSFGRYVAVQLHFPEMRYKIETPHGKTMSADTLEAAKAVAQSDYEARILAALDFAAAPDAAKVARLLEVLTMEPTDDMLASVCLSYRHDFGLMDNNQRRVLILTAREWWRSTMKEIQALAAMETPHD